MTLKNSNYLQFHSFSLQRSPRDGDISVSQTMKHLIFLRTWTSVSNALACIWLLFQYLSAFSVSICFSIICLWILILTIIFIICLFLYELNMLFSFLGICFYMNTSIFSPVIYSPGKVMTFKSEDHNHQRR